MAASVEFLISKEEELSLHRRLVDGDVTASADLATKFLDPLIDWLVEKNSSKVPKDICIEAAEDALIALVKSPRSFNPDRGMRLFAYLRMSAQGDLRNILRREGRQRQREMGFRNVELSRRAGKYLAEDGDQLRLLEIQEESARVTEQVVSPARHGLPEAELRALDLMLEGERKTAVFAEVLGISHLPKKVQRAQVKRLKDKLKKRLERGASGDGQSS
jgi:RNA polymerase sigma-70 factor (ECF subfamily)